MDCGAIEADILHVQTLMRASKLTESIEVIGKCLKALVNSNLTKESLANLSTVQQCLLVHLAMGLLYSEKFEESLRYFEKVNTRRIFNFISELVSTEASYGVERVFEASRDMLLHSYMNASVAAEQCHRPQLTQAYLEKAIQLYREKQLTQHEAVTWHRLGKLLVKLERHAQARLSLNTAALLFKKCEQSALEAESLCDLADVHWKSGNTSCISDTIARTHSLCLGLTHRPEEQRQLYRRISSLYREQRCAAGEVSGGQDTLSDGRGLERARAVRKRGQLLRGQDRERWERAMREAREECELAALSSPKEASRILISIATDWSETEVYGESESILERVVELSRSSDLELTLAESLERLGDVLIKQRREREAAMRYNEASMVLELKYNQTGDEKVGVRLQSVWDKHISLNSQGGQLLLNGTARSEHTSCQNTVTFFPDDMYLGNSCPKSTEPELHSLVTVSDLSEISGNENILAPDTQGNRSLSNQKNSEDSNAIVVESINHEINSKSRRRTQSTTKSTAFRSNRVSPVGSVTSRGSDVDTHNGQHLNPTTTNQENLRQLQSKSRSCVIL